MENRFANFFLVWEYAVLPRESCNTESLRDPNLFILAHLTDLLALGLNFLGKLVQSFGLAKVVKVDLFIFQFVIEQVSDTKNKNQGTYRELEFMSMNYWKSSIMSTSKST